MKLGFTEILRCVSIILGLLSKRRKDKLSKEGLLLCIALTSDVNLTVTIARRKEVTHYDIKSDRILESARTEEG